MANLLPHTHTGRLRSHQHTSYGGLFMVLVLAMLPILFSDSLVSADYNYGVYAQVPSPLPSTAPKITNIADGRVYVTNDSLQATGTCQNDTQVKLFKNGILGGSTLCKAGSFSLSFELFLGSNSLTVRSYNSDNIAGPESSPLDVKLVPLNTAGTSAITTNNQFFITSDAYYRGASSGKAITWLLTVAGGQAPYVIDISWGDGQTDQIGRGAVGQFKISHIYNQPSKDGGSYKVVIQAKDMRGDHALLQLVAIVPSGTTAATSSGGGGGSGWFSTKIAIQTLATTILIVFSFWIGERYELRLLKRQQLSPV